MPCDSRNERSDACRRRVKARVKAWCLLTRAQSSLFPSLYVLDDVAGRVDICQALLSGSASVLAAACWDAHGVPSMARVCALRHLRCDATAGGSGSGGGGGGDGDTQRPHNAAAASDTAAALASLVAHASTQHGPAAAAAALATAAARYGQP